MKRIVFASVTLIIALFFTGCKKEDVAPIEVAEVTMSQEIAEIEVGSTLQLAASVTPTADFGDDHPGISAITTHLS